jgi:flagellar hook-basal body complex protein FliE
MIDKIGSFPTASTASSAASSETTKSGGTTTGDDFGSMVTSTIASAVENIRAGEAAGAAGITGKAPLQEVVDKMIAAEHSLQTAIAVRDKIVAAYLEVSRMTI